MKLESVKYDTQTETNFEESEEVEMLISAEAMPHIAKILTNLYSNPEQSVFREYLANALDAHTMAGTTVPVEVFMPNANTPMFTVTDYGIGMSREEMTKIFSQYGRSNKTDSNDSIGGFGLGSKSALAIAPQFTVISVKDGWSTSAIIANTDLGTPRMTIVNHEESTDSNGTTVAIPVTNVSSFVNESIPLVPYISPSKATIYSDYNVEHYTKWDSDHLNSSSRATNSDTTNATLYTFKGGPSYYGAKLGDFVILIGDIPYSVQKSDLKSRGIGIPVIDEFNFRSSFILEVPIGEVSPAPSRESVHFTTKAIEYLKTTMDEIYQKLLVDYVDTVENAENYPEVMSAVRSVPFSFREKLMDDDRKILWNGVEILKVTGLYVAPQILNKGWEISKSHCCATYRSKVESGDPRIFMKDRGSRHGVELELKDDQSVSYTAISVWISSNKNKYMNTFVLSDEFVDFGRKISRFANSFPGTVDHDLYSINSLDDFYLDTSEGLVRAPSEFMNSLIEDGLNIIDIDEFNSTYKDQTQVEKEYRDKLAKDNPKAIKNPLDKTDYKMLFTNGHYSNVSGVAIDTFARTKSSLESVDNFFYITKSIDKIISNIFDFNRSTNIPERNKFSAIRGLLGNSSVVFVLSNRSESAFLDRCSQMDIKPKKIDMKFIEKAVKEMMGTRGLEQLVQSSSTRVSHLISNLENGITSGAYSLEDINDETLRAEVETYISKDESITEYSNNLGSLKDGLFHLLNKLPPDISNNIREFLTVKEIDEDEYSPKIYSVVDTYFYYGSALSTDKKRLYYLAAVNGIYDQYVLTNE